MRCVFLLSVIVLFVCGDVTNEVIMLQVASSIKIKSVYRDAGEHTCRGANGKRTWCRGVSWGSAGRRDGPGAGARVLGLSGACGGAHRGRRGPAPLAGEVGGGVRGEGGLSLVAGPSLLPLAAGAAAGGAGHADGRAQTSLRPSGEVINGAGQILEQKRGRTVSVSEAHPSI